MQRMILGNNLVSIEEKEFVIDIEALKESTLMTVRDRAYRYISDKVIWMNLESQFIADSERRGEHTEYMPEHKRFAQIRKTFRPRTPGV